MNKKIHNINDIRNQVRPHLRTYLVSQGVDINAAGKFRCFVHDDSNPSAHLHLHDMMWKCFGCGASGDIIDAYIHFEGRPSGGKDWVKQTLLPLASSFGISVGDTEMTEDEQKEFEIYRAHAFATRLLLTMEQSPVAKEKINSYGWSELTCMRFGVGSIFSTGEYFKQMEAAGYTRQFLNQIDLDNTRIFNPRCLIYSVKDEFGNTVGFSARNLDYESAVASAKAVAEEHGVDSIEARNAKDSVPQKYINSAQSDKDGNIKNPIYQKGSRLFGIHTRKPKTKSLYVFEGNADVVTAFNAGLQNVCAVCSNTFTKEHLNLVLDLGISNLVFVMDGDKGGKSGVDAFMKLVDEHLSNRPGFQVQIITLEDKEDPDSFIRKFGLNTFLDLKKTGLFYWRMKRALENHEEKLQLADEGVSLIVNEPDPIQRYSMMTQLAELTSVDYSAINQKVQQIVSAADSRIDEELASMAERTSQQLKRSPRAIIQILAGANVEIERMKIQSKGVTTQSILDATDGVFDKFEAAAEEVGLKTGWPLFDQWFGGFPIGAAFLTIPGKPNQGKSSWLSNATYRTLDYNNDAIVLSHTIDDAFRAYLSRLLAVKYRFPSKYFQVAGKYLKEDEAFKKAFYESKEWLKEMIGTERLIPLDVTMLPRTLSALESRIRSLRISHPSSPMLVIGDNFHLYQDGGGSPDGEAKTRNMSMATKTMANTYDVCIMMTMELPKGSLKPGERPRMINIKGTAGAAYDSNGNIGVYNDMKDFREESEMVWRDKDGNLNPVMELVFDKSKLLNGFDGNIYYKFHPTSGHLEEIPETEQPMWAAKATKKKVSGGGPSGGVSSSVYQPAAPLAVPPGTLSPLDNATTSANGQLF